jgi:hypothetical protein
VSGGSGVVRFMIELISRLFAVSGTWISFTFRASIFDVQHECTARSQQGQFTKRVDRIGMHQDTVGTVH